MNIIKMMKFKKFIYFSDSPLQLDYFKNHQHFSVGINHMEAFNIGEDTFLAITPTHKPGSISLPSYIMKYSKWQKMFVHYQDLTPAGAGMFKAFTANGDRYLFLGNKEDKYIPDGECSVLFIV